MFTLKNVRVITCEEKDWKTDNGKVGKYYPTRIKYGDFLYPMSSKIDLREFEETNTPVDLVFELQEKTPKSGQPYTGVRIVGIAE